MATKKRVRCNIIEFSEFVPVRDAMYSDFLGLSMALFLLCCFTSMTATYVLSDDSKNESLSFGVTVMSG